MKPSIMGWNTLRIVLYPRQLRQHGVRFSLNRRLTAKRYFGIIATRENKNGALVKLSSELVVRQKNLGITKPSELEPEGPAASSETGIP